jgi:acetate kinase
MINKISKKEYEEIEIKISVAINKLIKKLFHINQTTEIWLGDIIKQLKQIDALVYSATLEENSISTEAYLMNKAMMMRQKVQKILLENKKSKIIENTKNEFYQTYYNNIFNYIAKRIELVDKTIETLEDNYKTFDDKTK